MAAVLLLVAAAVAALPPGAEARKGKVYLNQFAVELDGWTDPTALARKYGFVNHGKVSASSFDRRSRELGRAFNHVKVCFGYAVKVTLSIISTETLEGCGLTRPRNSHVSPISTSPVSTFKHSPSSSSEARERWRDSGVAKLDTNRLARR